MNDSHRKWENFVENFKFSLKIKKFYTKLKIFVTNGSVLQKMENNCENQTIVGENERFLLREYSWKIKVCKKIKGSMENFCRKTRIF